MAITANRPTGLQYSNAASAALLRAITGSVTGESATRTVAQFAASLGVNCLGLETVMLGVEFGTGGTSVVIEPLFLDELAGLWCQYIRGADEGVTALAAVQAYVTPAIAPATFVEVPVRGMRSVLFRVNTVNGGPLTNLQIIGYAGKPRGR